MMRLSDNIASKMQEIADRKGLGLSTAIREIVCEHLNTIAPAGNAAKQETTGVVSTVP